MTVLVLRRERELCVRTVRIVRAESSLPFSRSAIGRQAAAVGRPTSPVDHHVAIAYRKRSSPSAEAIVVVVARAWDNQAEQVAGNDSSREELRQWALLKQST